MKRKDRFYWVHICTKDGDSHGRTWKLKKNAIRRAKALVASCPEITIVHVLTKDPWGDVSVAEFKGKAWDDDKAIETMKNPNSADSFMSALIGVMAS